jgi:hypothetical protein
MKTIVLYSQENSDIDHQPVKLPGGGFIFIRAEVVDDDPVAALDKASPRISEIVLNSIPYSKNRYLPSESFELLRPRSKTTERFLGVSFHFSTEIEASAHNPKTREVFVNPDTWDALNEEEKIEMLAHECRCLDNIPANPDGNA